MCGIVGHCQLQSPVDQLEFLQKLDQISYRGPDAYGVHYCCNGHVALGHRRLSIIDLSDAGSQPMCNEDGTLWIIYNGEIYNYGDLREKLITCGHSFASNTDTEVILHAYEEWGENCVQYFRGIFAFGLWDEKQCKLFLARDHIGVKPLYYYYDGRSFIFASQLKAIIADPSVPRRIRQDAVCDYLTYGYVPYDKSILDNTWKLPAGHFLTFVDGMLRIEKYWDVTYTGEITDEREAVECLKEALREAVELQLVSDVPVGVLLSGGIDSSGVTALMARTYSQVTRTFTIGFDTNSHDETSYARLVASLYHTQHHEKLLTYDLAKTLVDSFAGIYDEPFFDSSGIPTYLLSKMVQAHVKVALSGDGGDEVFAGYQRYDKFSKLVAATKPNPMLMLGVSCAYPFLQKVKPLHWRLDVFARRAAAVLRDPLKTYFDQTTFLNRNAQLALFTPEMKNYVPENELWLYQRYWQDQFPRITAAQYLDLKTYLVDDILVKVDRASMFTGLELRVPLLDHKLVELAFRISPKLMYKNGERKYLLKQALADILPEEVLSSRKKGFSVPMDAWFDAGFKETANKFLLNGSLVNRSILERNQLKRYLQVESPDRIWLIFALELWIRRWLDI